MRSGTFRLRRRRSHATTLLHFSPLHPLIPLHEKTFRRNAFWPLLVAATIFFASSRSAVAAPGVVDFDKVVHFAVYGLLATLIVRLGRGSRAAVIALVLTSLYGASDEWHQSLVPGRASEMADWIADTCGGVLAIVLYTGWPWYRARLETSLGPKRRIENPAPVATV
jgi:VanZ family protein